MKEFKYFYKQSQFSVSPACKRKLEHFAKKHKLSLKMAVWRMLLQAETDGLQFNKEEHKENLHLNWTDKEYKALCKMVSKVTPAKKPTSALIEHLVNSYWTE